MADLASNKIEGTWTIVDDGEVIAQATVKEITDHEAIIEHLQVREEFKSTGAGLNLLQSIIKEADKYKITISIDLLVNMMNETDVQKAYEALGFKERSHKIHMVREPVS